MVKKECCCLVMNWVSSCFELKNDELDPNLIVILFVYMNSLSKSRELSCMAFLVERLQ